MLFYSCLTHTLSLARCFEQQGNTILQAAGINIADENYGRADVVHTLVPFLIKRDILLAPENAMIFDGFPLGAGFPVPESKEVRNVSVALSLYFGIGVILDDHERGL
jgi:hypothetical protein